MKIRTINLDGQTIRVAVRTGLSNKTPILMLNGIGATIELVMPFLKALDPELEVIAFDVPGVGGSPTPSGPYRFSNLTRTVAHMLNHLGYDQVDVIGLSWGGFLAQQFVRDYPKLCRKLILAATSTGFFGAVPPKSEVLNLMGNSRRYTDPDYAATIAGTIYGGQFRYDKELALTHAKKMVADKAIHGERRKSDQGYNYQLGAVLFWSSITYLHAIKQPTLLLAGSDDPIIPLCNMKVLSTLIPNSEMHVFDDGHLFLLTDLPKVLPIITEFLQ